MITIVIINVVRVFCTFSLCTDAPSPQKKSIFSEGRGRSVHRLLQMSCDKYPVTSHS